MQKNSIQSASLDSIAKMQQEVIKSRSDIMDKIYKSKFKKTESKYSAALISVLIYGFLILLFISVGLLLAL